MASVTQRIKQIKQPRGGYLNPKLFEQVVFNDNKSLNSNENIHASLVGLVVDYLTRFLSGASKEEAFKISLTGARIIQELRQADNLLSGIEGLDDQSITNACQLVGYDVCYRVGVRAYKPVELIQPDQQTIENIRILVTRSLDFLTQYGPVVADGLSFEGAYSDLITAGDCDFLTSDTLWDFKVSVNGPTSAHTLQLLIYYLMGKRSIHSEFQTVTSLGVFNPRLNKAYLLRLDEIADEVLSEVEEVVIGYNSLPEPSTIAKETSELDEEVGSSPIKSQDSSLMTEENLEASHSSEECSMTPISCKSTNSKTLAWMVGLIVVLGLLWMVFISSSKTEVRDIRAEFESFKAENSSVLTTGLGFFRFYDLQISFLRTYDVQNVEESELVYELSDELLNAMYQELKQNSTPETFETLKDEQLRWIKHKKELEAQQTDEILRFNELRFYTLDKCEAWANTYYR